jgi:hypothetical protein
VGGSGVFVQCVCVCACVPLVVKPAFVLLCMHLLSSRVVGGPV